MKKIFIIGTVASGKTTLARRLSTQLNVPCYELDSIVHHQTNEGRIKRTPEEQIDVIRDIDIRGNWILEGTDRESYQCLYDMADTIIFLDTPLWKRRMRILIRFLKQKIGLEKCLYDSNLAMLKLIYKWTNDFERDRSYFDKKLNSYNEKVIRISDTNLNHIQNKI